MERARLTDGEMAHERRFDATFGRPVSVTDPSLPKSRLHQIGKKMMNGIFDRPCGRAANPGAKLSVFTKVTASHDETLADVGVDKESCGANGG